MLLSLPVAIAVAAAVVVLILIVVVVAAVAAVDAAAAAGAVTVAVAVAVAVSLLLLLLLLLLSSLLLSPIVPFCHCSRHFLCCEVLLNMIQPPSFSEFAEHWPGSCLPKAWCSCLGQCLGIGL